jgi:hypothetical protein
MSKSIIVLLLTSMFMACGNGVEVNTDGNTVIRQERTFGQITRMDDLPTGVIELECIDGITYMYKYGVKIDPATMKPQTCSTDVTIIPKVEYADHTKEDLVSELIKLKQQLEAPNKTN